ncbi:MAG: methyltransferase domain-containing protein [Flavobacteriales bacterium]|nr:methyltransferase domain-containing protein [Flavobacteriales bacterium]
MLDKEFWDNRYKYEQTSWDIGYPSTPLKEFIDSLENKGLHILIPGCGRAYEAEYLYNKGFKNISVIDLSPTALDQFSKRMPSFPKESLTNANFFNHKSKYDIILEQTFFCAIDRGLRENYVKHSYELLNDGGKIVGLLFNEEFGNEHPPFGGTKDEYLNLFSGLFDIEIMKTATNSIEQRKGRELFISFKKKKL